MRPWRLRFGHAAPPSPHSKIADPHRLGLSRGDRRMHRSDRPDIGACLPLGQPNRTRREAGPFDGLVFLSQHQGQDAARHGLVCGVG